MIRKEEVIKRLKEARNTIQPFPYVDEAIDYVVNALEQEPCEDYINRQAAKKALEDRFMELQKRHSEDRYETNFCLNTILELPSVTPQLKMGHWEWVRYDSNSNIGNWHCSECRTIIPHMPEETDNTPIYKWCPMCGAKMQEVEE